MQEILLIEPNYFNKYPPLGLMKISYYHKKIRKDYVRFAKGQLLEAYDYKKWDRVYVTTLFTFEWEETKKSIEYALKVCKSKEQVIVGGILATLMPELIRDAFGIEPVTGLLNMAGKLGLPHDECIDTLPPDYSILEDTKEQYQYPANDAYFLYATRGCGMKCQFCAVQTLEPTYIPYISIKEQLDKVKETSGEKRDLLLMDNNVLKSNKFDQIVEDIISLGFGKGAKYYNPKTGKQIVRYVDFNQGLDAKLLTEHKATQLGRLALKPARIAFDHIEDLDVYTRAIALCAKNGIKHLSNYILFNGEDFTGKGSSYKADTPEDLFNRMKISMDLCDELNELYGEDGKIHIFSFPMRYIPLQDTKRGFVGTNWNGKYLRAVQRMLIPTAGKGVSSRSFFEADFGVTQEDFIENLAMPEDLLSLRGHFVIKKEESIAERKDRKKQWCKNQERISEWRRVFRLLENEKLDFIEVIKNNDFSAKNLKQISSQKQRNVFLHYMSNLVLLKSINEFTEGDIKYIFSEFNLFYQNIIEYIFKIKVQYSAFIPMLKLRGEEFFADIINQARKEKNLVNNGVFTLLYKAQVKNKNIVFDTRCLDYAICYSIAGVIKKDEYNRILKKGMCHDIKGVKRSLKRNFKNFVKACSIKVNSEICSELLKEKLNDSVIGKIEEYLREA